MEAVVFRAQHQLPEGESNQPLRDPFNVFRLIFVPEKSHESLQFSGCAFSGNRIYCLRRREGISASPIER